MASEKKPVSIKSILMEMVERIRSKNNEPGLESIPSSDDIHKRILGDLGISREDTENYIKMLIDSHYIFSFKMVEGNEKMKEKPIFGFVIAEHKIVSDNIEKLKRGIESIYEKQNYKKKPAGEVIKEVLSQGRHNNTPIGKAVNAAIMLQQYEGLLREKAEDYTEVWKIGQLNDILMLADKELPKEQSSEQQTAEAGTEKDSGETQERKPDEAVQTGISVDLDMDDYGGMDERIAGKTAAPPLPGGATDGYMRAVDSPSAAELQNMDLAGGWGQAVQKFGVEFLLRIHFRKYEFDIVIGLVKTKKIALENDLRFIRDTMRKLTERMNIDTRLVRHREKIEELKRITQMKLNEIFMANKR